MELLSLNIENFNTHENTSIDFTRLQSPILIKGVNHDKNKYSNGAGKSSIFNAIYVALFDKPKEFVTLGKDYSKVDLTFKHKGVKYRVVKTWKDPDWTVQFYKEQELITDSKTEFDKLMNKMIGISKEVYSQTIYQSQGFLNFFSYLTPKLKASFIADLLNTKKLEQDYKVSLALHREILDTLNSTRIKENITKEQINKLKADLEKIDINGLQTQKKDLESQLKTVEESLEDMSKVKLLEQNLADSQQKLREVEGRITEVLEDIQKTTKNVAKFAASFLSLKAKKVSSVDESTKQSVLASVTKAEADIAGIKREITLREQQLHELVSKNKAILEASICPFCNRKIDESYKNQVKLTLEQTEKEADNTIQELKSKLQNLENIKRTQTDKLAELHQQAVVYQEHISKLAEAQQKYREYKVLLFSKITLYLNLKQQKKETEIRIEDIKKNLKNIDTQEYDQLQRKKQELKTELKEKEEAIFNYSQINKQMEALEHTKKELGQEMKRLNKKHLITKHITNILSPQGIQKWLYLRTLEEIALFANELLKPTSYSIQFLFEKRKTTKEGYKPAFDILVNTPKGQLNIKRLSGGEGAIVNFALRLAFSAILATTYDFKFLIIDEGFENMDTQYRELAANLLLGLKDQFQIFVVTHLQDFEMFFPNCLIVERRHNISKVII